MSVDVDFTSLQKVGEESLLYWKASDGRGGCYRYFRDKTSDSEALDAVREMVEAEETTAKTNEEKTVAKSTAAEVSDVLTETKRKAPKIRAGQ